MANQAGRDQVLEEMTATLKAQTEAIQALSLVLKGVHAVQCEILEALASEGEDQDEDQELEAGSLNLDGSRS